MGRLYGRWSGGWLSPERRRTWPAARRGVREETGLEVGTDRLVAVIDRTDLLLVVFAGRVVGGTLTPQASEIAELAWFTGPELAAAAVFEAVRLVRPVLFGGEGGLLPAGVAWPDGRAHPGFLAASL